VTTFDYARQMMPWRVELRCALQDETKGLPETTAPPTSVKNARISERPFPSDPALLPSDLRERGPLLQTFSFALSEWLARRSLLHRAAQAVRRVDPRDYLARLRPHAAEFGVYQGYSLCACIETAERMRIPVTFFGFDTFAGLPELSSQDRHSAPIGSPYLERKLYTHTSALKVRNRSREKLRRSGVVLFEGLFDETCRRAPDRKFFFANIDCDLYEGHLQSLNYVYPRMEKGGVVYFDDYQSLEYPMARVAIDEFLADKPEQLWHLRYGEDGANLTKSFLIKA
jgi:O-methyltransferase